MSVPVQGTNYKVTEVFSKQEAYPLIISFQNGNLQQTGKVECEAGIYSDPSSKKPKNNAIIALNNMLYVGQENDDNVCRNLIVARNRNTGAVRLIEVGNVLVNALPESEQKENRAEPLDFTDARRQLGEAFGSKRQKRMLEQSKKMKIDIDTMKDQLEKTVNENQIDVLDISQHEVNTVSMLGKYAPPINRDASNIKDIYDINDILNKEQMESLKDTATAVLEDENYEIELSEFIANEISLLRASPNVDNVKVCCMLLYANCIMKYLKDPYNNIRNTKYVVCSYSEMIDKFIFDSFSMASDKGRTRPNSLKDKAMCYLIVVLLLAKNYCINDAMTLGKLSATTLPKLSQMAKVVGAHVIKDQNNATIVLKLPLAPPPSLMMNKRKR